MNYANYWTGLADFISNGDYEMPGDSIGVIVRVVTLANNKDEFIKKVDEVFQNIGLKLIVIEEVELFNVFLDKEFVTEDHEIYEFWDEIINLNDYDVVCGYFHFYSSDDA